MEIFLNNIGSIISSLGVIILGFFTYNQYTRNKRTDYKIEAMKAKEEENKETIKQKRIIYNERSAIIYGELWEIIINMKACRAYIIQPHPLDNSKFFSIQYEVAANGTVRMKPEIQDLPMDKVPWLCGQLVEHDLLIIEDTSDIPDKTASSIFVSKGSDAAIVKKLTDGKRWVGSIFCEYKGDVLIDICDANKMLKEKEYIGFILPEILN